MDLFSLRESRGICPRDCGPDPHGWLMGSQHSESPWTVRVGLDGSREAPSSSGGVRMLHDGATAAPRRRNPILCYGSQISIMFGPMASRWRGESVFAHLERWRSTVAAGDGGMIRVDHGDSGSLLRRLGCPIFVVQ
jgi:hypothetical protein